jgi:hypothetical protein
MPKNVYFFFYHGARAPFGQGLLIIEDSRSHSDRQTTLWTSDQPDAETTRDNTQHSQETDIRVPGGVGTHNPSKRATAHTRAATGIGKMCCLYRDLNTGPSSPLPSRYTDYATLAPKTYIIDRNSVWQF